jgi:hypothetical protein
LTDVVEDEERLVEVVDALVGDPERCHDRVLRGRRLFVADAADLVERASTGRTQVATAVSE